MAQGVIGHYIHHNKQIGAMARILCATDFAARCEELQRFAARVAMQAAGFSAVSYAELVGYQQEMGVIPTIEDERIEVAKKLGEAITVAEIALLRVDPPEEPPAPAA